MSAPVPIVTALYAGLLGLIVLVLAARVSRARARLGIEIGDGADPAMLRAIRVHANAVETVPIALVIMGLVEMAGAPALVLHVYGIALVVGRLLHAWGFSRARGRSFGRVVGMCLSWLALAGLSLYAIYLFAAGIWA